MSKAILAHLSAADPVLAGVIRAVGPAKPPPPEDGHPFEVLARAIAHQQLNGTAANTILGRLIQGCGQGAFPTPQLVIAASVESLRAAGFSFAKVAALKDLAARTLDSVVPDAAALAAALGRGDHRAAHTGAGHRPLDGGDAAHLPARSAGRAAGRRLRRP